MSDRNASVSAEQFLKVYRDRVNYPTAKTAAAALGMKVASYNTRCANLRSRFGHLPALQNVPTYPKGGGTGGGGRKLTDELVSQLLGSVEELNTETPPQEGESAQENQTEVTAQAQE